MEKSLMAFFVGKSYSIILNIQQARINGNPVHALGLL